MGGAATNTSSQAMDQRYLLDFLKLDQARGIQKPESNPSWMSPNVQSQAGQGAQIAGVDPKNKASEDEWKQDPRIQAIIADHMQQIETDVHNEVMQGKRMKSGSFNITDSFNNASYRRWLNEGV